jgi:hypothetical protein
MIILISFLINIIFVENQCKYKEINIPYNKNNIISFYSPDGKSYAIIVEKEGKRMIFKDWVEKEYNNNLPPSSNILAEPDIIYNGEKISLVLFVSLQERGVLKNGVEISRYSKIREITKSPDGKSFAFIARKNSKEIIVKDLIEGEEYDEVRDITYSLDWKSFAFVGRKDWKQFIVKDWKNLWEWNSPISSPDWKDFIFIAIKNKERVLVKNWVEISKYNFIGYPTYSPDGKGFVYLAKKGEKNILVKDWVELDTYDGIGMKNTSLSSEKNFTNLYSPYSLSFSYSPDGKSFVYLAKKGKKTIIVKDWIESKEYDTILDFIYSPSGKSLTFLAGKFNDLESKKRKQEEYEKGTLLAYNIMPDKWMFVTNGIECKEYDDVLYPRYSSDTGKLRFLAKKDNKRMLVEQPCE